MNDKKIIEMVEASDVFGEVSGDAKALIVKCRRREYRAGEEVSEDDGRMLGVVLSGLFEITSADGGRVLMNTVGAGGVFGAAAVFRGENTVSSIKARRIGEVLFIPRDTLERIFAADPAAAANYARFLSDRIYFLNKKIISLSSPRADASIAGYIADNATDGEIKMNVSSVAKRLGVGRTTFYNALGVLERDGIICRDGGKIVIKDTEKLASRRKHI